MVTKTHATSQRHLANTENKAKKQNRRVRNVVAYDTPSASRDLSERRVTEAELFEQESIVAEQVGSLLCVHKWRGRVGLEIPIAFFRIGEIPKVRCTYAISDDKNRVLELLRAVRGELLDGTDGEFVRVVTGKIVVKTNSFGKFLIIPQSPDSPNLFGGGSVKTGGCKGAIDNSQVGETSRVVSTIISKISFIVVLPSLSLSAPEMASRE